MTIKPRTVRALKDVRIRMRDAAAAAHTAAAAMRDQAAADLEDEEDTLEIILDQAPAKLSSARNIFEVEQVDEDTGVHRLDVLAAQGRAQAAAAASAVTGDQLRERARQLRSAERIVERVEEHYARIETRTEQRHSDDIAARPRHWSSK